MEVAKKPSKEQVKGLQRDIGPKKAAGNKEAEGGFSNHGPGAGRTVDKKAEQVMTVQKGAGNLSPPGHK
ncbi:unnamed protein product [Linum trigynum]